jgi:putative transposase
MIYRVEFTRNTCIGKIANQKKQLQKAISLYNNDRSHMSIGNLTPNKLDNNKKLNPQRLWKNYFKKINTFENKNENHPVNLFRL